MKKIELGDIFELDTKKGYAYFQCIKIDKIRCDTIKVFNRLYQERPQSIIDLTEVTDFYFIGFPLTAALKRKIVEKAGNIPLPNNFKLPVYTRDKHVIGGKLIGWYIIDENTLKMQFVEKLSEEQMRLSPAGVWNDTLLKEKLEEGWSLEDWK